MGRTCDQRTLGIASLLFGEVMPIDLVESVPLFLKPSLDSLLPSLTQAEINRGTQATECSYRHYKRAAVTNYLNGGDWKIIAEFTEVESGRRADRPQLAAAFSSIIILAVDDLRLGRMKLQPAFSKTSLKRALQSLRLALAATVAEDIIGKTLERDFWMVCDHPAIERIIQKWLNTSASSDTAVGWRTGSALWTFARCAGWTCARAFWAGRVFRCL